MLSVDPVDHGDMMMTRSRIGTPEGDGDFLLGKLGKLLQGKGGFARREDPDGSILFGHGVRPQTGLGRRRFAAGHVLAYAVPVELPMMEEASNAIAADFA